MVKDLSAGKTKRRQARHTPLAKQIEDDNTIKARVRTGKLAKKDQEDFTEEEYVTSKLSKKILDQARKQAEEEDDENDIEEFDDDDEEEMEEAKPAAKKAAEKKKVGGFKSFEELMAEDDDTESQFSEFSETESQFADDVVVNEEDEKALAMFMNPAGPRRLLSDIIMEKIQAHGILFRQYCPLVVSSGRYNCKYLLTTKERAMQAKEEGSSRPKMPPPPQLKPEIAAVYTKMASLLMHHTSGKLPKAFRILPSLRNWEQLLYLTRPDKWSPVTTRMATVLFSRGMSDKLAQRFYYVILLPKIREQIDLTKKLTFHYYLALKKAMYRPAAFFRGILLPLCDSGDCSLREAVILGSVLKRVSIPAIHASVAIYKLCQMPYYGATQHLLLILINKKFSLPYKVVDEVYNYFMNFIEDERKFPGLWHQTLLIFVQRYKGDLTAEQKEGLVRLMKVHHNIHYTQETRRELYSTKARGEAPAATTTTTTASMEM